VGRLLAATRAVETDNETAADLAYLRGRGTSLGGMRPKCTEIDGDGLLSIGKFPSVNDERAVTKGEVLAMNLAKAAGIRVAEARLVESDGLPVALIRRFDRTDGGRRLMYVSAATLLGADSGETRDHFYTEIVDAIRVHGADSQSDIEELWRRMAFTILITNVDDHLHNHGFLHMNHGLWSLRSAPSMKVPPTLHIELLAGDVHQHHAVAAGKAELAQIVAARVAELGIFGQIVRNGHRVLPGLLQRVRDPLDRAVDIEIGEDLVDVVEGFEFPVLHLQQKKSAGWMEDQEVRIVPAGPMGTSNQQR
jgi:hypothetical protein